MKKASAGKSGDAKAGSAAGKSAKATAAPAKAGGSAAAGSKSADRPASRGRAGAGMRGSPRIPAGPTFKLNPTKITAIDKYEERKADKQHLSTSGGYRVGVIQFTETGRRVPYLIVPRSESDRMNLLKQFASAMNVGRPDIAIQLVGTSGTSYTEWARAAYADSSIRKAALWRDPDMSNPDLVPDEVFREYSTRVMDVTSSIMEVVAETGGWVLSDFDRRASSQLVAHAARHADVLDRGYRWIGYGGLDDLPEHVSGLKQTLLDCSEELMDCPTFEKVKNRVVIKASWDPPKGTSPFLSGDELWKKELDKHVYETSAARYRDIGTLNPFATHFIFYYDDDQRELITDLPFELKRYGVSIAALVPHMSLDDSGDITSFSGKRIPVLLYKNSGGPLNSLIRAIDFQNDVVATRGFLQQMKAAQQGPGPGGGGKGGEVNGPFLKFLKKWIPHIPEEAHESFLKHLPALVAKEKAKKASKNQVHPTPEESAPPAGDGGDVEGAGEKALDDEGNVLEEKADEEEVDEEEQKKRELAAARKRAKERLRKSKEKKASLYLNPRASSLSISEKLERLKKFSTIFSTYMPFFIPPEMDTQDLITFDILKDQTPSKAQTQITQLLNSNNSGPEEMGKWETERLRIFEAWSQVARFTMNRNRQMQIARGLQYTVLFLNLLVVMISVFRMQLDYILGLNHTAVNASATNLTIVQVLTEVAESSYVEITFIALPIVASVMLTVLTRFTPHAKASSLKVAAEMTKSEILKYRAKVGEYSGAKTDPWKAMVEEAKKKEKEKKKQEKQAAAAAAAAAAGGEEVAEVEPEEIEEEQALADAANEEKPRETFFRRVKEIAMQVRMGEMQGDAFLDMKDEAFRAHVMGLMTMADVKTGEEEEEEDDENEGSKKDKKAEKSATVQDDGSTMINGGTYVRLRLMPLIRQLKYESPRLMSQTAGIQALIFIFQGLATLFAAFNSSLYVTLSIAFVSAISSIGEFERPQEKLRMMNECLKQLEGIVQWWTSLSVVEGRTTAAVEELILRTEDAYVNLVSRSVATSKSKGSDEKKKGGGDGGEDGDKKKEDENKPKKSIVPRAKSVQATLRLSRVLSGGKDEAKEEGES
uniref:Uncharacterized protein n=1 Tax=Palpitomonas bilix TaxID=652834 RepID=A0A7S3LWF8_9EUKA|mmetsp:Transcript_6568/g.16342  ORF Transcript_6568/g.16342 Transcript_6568/m.16342 type:complete len:1105 (+) Transcript_6568:157-3471(+)|eukprot:CAMPEP_0113910382 /NCGR_PEP_ID=MMETSP0780_2-20120614/27486_1 /TAXON_ID=652834 /ORGANISM="Palpitomonas bilix" /LENGTH=1104 /DNA_ID=CAMNT_0000906515 /DNA_START=53 /DNA_END=3367 /DNA_ORIENTATION=- /assembly_acc=CAM_ASM_000599